MQTSGVDVGVGLDYWLKWHVPVCGLIMIIPALVALKLINSSSSSSSSSSLNDLWVPCWRNLSPRWLLLYRASAFVTMAFLLYQMVLFAGLFAFYFYTQWTFALVMLYFALGTIISARGCFMSSDKMQTASTEKDNLLRNGLQANTHNNNNLPKTINVCEADQGAGFLGSAFLIVYQMSAGASILTDLVFWCILMPMMSGKEFELTLVIGCIHSLNAVFLIIDSLLNALPFRWFGFNYFIIWTVTYAIFQWVLHACGFTWWPYPFLELATPWAPLWYLAIALIHIPCYGLYILIVKAKNAIFSKLFPRVFLRSHKGPSDHKKAA
ncbi:hypothetical protein RND81_05G018300 [Saponaria officinalis]|uniref:Uncharacterized protein n=1 Tax=Saponaria officinalis TaxID=3572 RepID=A0AAW1KQE9_SAPOF